VDAQIETVGASIIPPEITTGQLASDANHDPSPKLEIMLFNDGTQARQAVKISSITMLTKRILLAHCAK
jgi:hypothetical protein